ncbi:unnamed protein product [Allacma fusca]|uniref:Uncharacterized protein n=1 Tax=Allacma fusca TaxID=39272 RepID=A0A8J2PUN7_9HEXA|nr:unnamed protein product [Allacma fusca]
MMDQAPSRESTIKLLYTGTNNLYSYRKAAAFTKSFFKVYTKIKGYSLLCIHFKWKIYRHKSNKLLNQSFFEHI